MRLECAITLGVALGLMLAPEGATAASLILLEREADGVRIGARAEQVSADGSVVIGAGFRWTSGNGLESFGSLSADLVTDPRMGLSDDGSTIVGGLIRPQPQAQEAFRWTESEGLQPLGGFYSRALGVSADGSIAAGVRDISNSVSQQAVRWDARGEMHDLARAAMATSTSSAARDISADGSVIVGEMLAWDESGPGRLRAFRWDQESGIETLGVLPDRSSSVSMAVSADGSTIVGFSGDGFSSPREAFRWDARRGMQALDGVDAIATDVSRDGSLVVGLGLRSDEDAQDFEQTALLWTADDEKHDLNVFLAALGLELEGVRLVEASGISADGTTIVGMGQDAAGMLRPFIATIPEPSTSVLLGLGLLGLSVVPHSRRNRTAD